MKRHSAWAAEALESRTFLSAVTPTSAAPSVVEHSAVVKNDAIGTTAGVTLHLKAGVAFSGVVAFYSTPVLDPPLGYFASIDWGDGTITSATLQYGTHGTDFGENVVGAHTYKTAGTYKIVTKFSDGPINPALAFPTTLLATIDSTAIVAAPIPQPTAVVVGHVLKITGTPFNDTIDVAETPVANSRYGSHLYVSINGMSWKFSATGITSITVDAGSGNDTVDLGGGSTTAVRIDAIIHGDNGNDTLTGGAGTDSLYGDEGNDTLIASPGGDSAYGGPGDDTAIEIGPGAPPPPNVPPPPTYRFAHIASDVEHIVLPG